MNAQGDVKIGTQVWMTKNLDVDRFRNGDLIPEAKNAKEWEKLESETAAFCYYEYDSKNGKVYGKLYNWYAVKDPRGLAPKGYHIPSDAEWTILTEFLGGEEKALRKMQDTTDSPNSCGFKALEGGYCSYSGWMFNGTDTPCIFWSSSEDSTATYTAWSRGLSFFSTQVSRGNSNKYNGLSVRCIKD